MRVIPGSRFLLSHGGTGDVERMLSRGFACAPAPREHERDRRRRHEHYGGDDDDRGVVHETLTVRLDGTVMTRSVSVRTHMSG